MATKEQDIDARIEKLLDHLEISTLSQGEIEKTKAKIEFLKSMK